MIICAEWRITAEKVSGCLCIEGERDTLRKRDQYCELKSLMSFLQYYCEACGDASLESQFIFDIVTRFVSCWQFSVAVELTALQSKLVVTRRKGLDSVHEPRKGPGNSIHLSEVKVTQYAILRHLFLQLHAHVHL